MSKGLMIFILLFSLGCDNKKKATYVAKSAYNELLLKYEHLEEKNRLLQRQNRKLSNENEILKHNLQKYRDGFKSMYE